VKFFFDNNLSPHLAHAIRELCKTESARVSEVVHLRDKFAPNAKDHDWITELSNDSWIVISQDGLRKNDVERDALRKSGLIVFVLHSQWAHQKFWAVSHNLVKWWPAITEQSEKIKGGAAFRVPWKFMGSGRFEQIRL
jgi:hypothetical protein